MWRLLVSLLVTVGLANAGFPVPRNFISNVRAEDSAFYRLPEDVKPLSYYVELDPNLIAKKFTGYTEIEVEAIAASNSITLHIDSIDILSVSVKLGGIGNIDTIFDSFNTTNDERQFLILNLTEDLVPGSIYNILINYTGILHDDNDGFYRAEYVDDSGITRYLATTQFESTSARRAFPCFDEPALKATFRIAILRSPEYNSVSNMPLKESLDQGGKFLDLFEETIVMPTYLVAFIVSDFNHSTDGGRQGVLATPANIAAGNEVYALEVGESILKDLEDFTTIPFAIAKMDQAAIPNNYFAAGAMENWGLVTYRERYLLLMEGQSTSIEKQLIASVIAHEYAHQWFGDLVSPLWWKYIWLNEGFATYFEYHTTAKVEKDWRLEEQFVVDVVQNALAVDAYLTTRAMSTDAGTPNQISSLFDRIAYDKSGSVIRMWEGILTQEIFRAGLTNHLKAKEYGVAQATDLYAGFQKALDESTSKAVLLPDGLDIRGVMETWELQNGYPLVTVEVDRVAKIIKLSQKRYLAEADDGTDKSIWHIPINYATTTNPDFSSTDTALWLSLPEMPIVMSDSIQEDWIIINKQAKGFYRIKYDEDNWARITDYLLTSDNINKIDPRNRAQLIDDAFTLAKNGHLNFSVPLDLSKYLIQETDYIPITAYLNSISSLNRLLAGSPNFAAYKTYVASLLEKTSEVLGFDEAPTDSHINMMNRANILNLLCKFSDGCKTMASTRLQAWITDETATVAPNLESAVYCGALAKGDEAEWNFLFTKYQEATLDTTRARLLTSLGCSEQVGILRDFMNKSLNAETTIRQADRVGVFTAVMSGSNIGLDAAFDFVENNFEAIKASEGLGNSALNNILSNIGSRYTTAAQLEKLTALSTANPEDAAIFAGALANIKTNLKWLETYEDDINSWVNVYTPEPNFGTVNTFGFATFSLLLVISMYQYFIH